MCQFILLTAIGCTDQLSSNAWEDYILVPSPNWEDQIIYFIVTDRFMDGDSTNNDQGVGEYRRGHGRYWNGGDLQGVRQKIDYIKALGATGIWITPPVANQWVNPQKTGTGNHGYWAENFIEVDKHLGTLEDYQRLASALHKEGMYLIQDVVCNHLGDFYTYTGDYDPTDVTKHFKRYSGNQPTQFPFNHNNALDSSDLAMGIYHFAPNFYDHSDTIKKRSYQYADLDDLNTENPVVRTALRKSFNFWIGKVGVDGFRFDTPHFVEHEFWHDFIHSDEPGALGVEKFADSIGKNDFFTFGETALFPEPLSDIRTKEAERYLGSSTKPQMNSILNFPLTISIGRVFQEKKATHLLTHRLESANKIFAHPELLVNFIDNHDGARFLTNADRESFKQALLFIMTIPGVPVIYYGTEQELLGMRQAMFKGGVGSPDKDHFDTESASFKFVQDLIKLRKENGAFRQGKIRVLHDSKSGPGAFVYEMQGEGETLLVLINTARTEMLVDNISTKFPPGTFLRPLFSLTEGSKIHQVDHSGEINLKLPASAGLVLVADGKGSPATTHLASLDFKSSGGSPAAGSTEMNLFGMASGTESIQIAIDGDLSDAREFAIDASGKWSGTISLVERLNGEHKISAYSSLEKQDQFISDQITIQVDHQPQLLAQYIDPLGDDHGPNGSYGYPQHESYGRNMDIAKVEVFALGSNLEVDLTMREISQTWIPPNGFDHLLVNIFIDIPELEGKRLLPLLNANMPDQEDWDFLISSAGFGNAMFSSQQATKDQMGEKIGPSANISVDKANNMIRFLISAQSMGWINNVEGVKLFITTWGGGPSNPRGLAEEPSTWAFSGGDFTDPKIMDATDLITL